MSDRGLMIFAVGRKGEPMDDLISRQAAIDLIDGIETERLKGTVELTYAPAIKGLRALPSAQPEIIRCKDCKYYREYGYVNGKPKFLPKCGFNDIYVREDDFCSKAERQT